MTGDGGTTKNGNHLTPSERRALVWTATGAVVCLAGAVISGLLNAVLFLAAFVGALGGVIHEIAQSRGKILFFEKHGDGLYLGSLAGMVLGAAAGIIAVRGFLAGTGATIGAVEIGYESFVAGLALKGITEAAAGNPTKKE